MKRGIVTSMQMKQSPMRATISQYNFELTKNLSCRTAAGDSRLLFAQLLMSQQETDEGKRNLTESCAIEENQTVRPVVWVQTEKDPSIAISKLFERFSPRLPRGHSSLNSRDHKGQLLCRPTQRKQNTAGARTKHPVARATTPALLRISEIKSNRIWLKQN